MYVHTWHAYCSWEVTNCGRPDRRRANPEFSTRDLHPRFKQSAHRVSLYIKSSSSFPSTATSWNDLPRSSFPPYFSGDYLPSIFQDLHLEIIGAKKEGKKREKIPPSFASGRVGENPRKKKKSHSLIPGRLIRHDWFFSPRGGACFDRASTGS